MPSLASKTSAVIRSVVVGALVVGSLLLLAFGPRATEELPADRVIVEYWEKWTGPEAAGMQAVVDEFNTTVGREKKIFIRYLSTSAVERKALVAIAAGVPPDIAGLYNQNIPQFAALDALMPLDDLATEHGITADDYKKVFWDECRYEEKLYGLVSTAFDLALYYNTEVFAQRADALRARGLDPTRAPRTIAELDAYAEALDVVDSSGRPTAVGYIPLEPDWFKNYQCIWFGGRWWDDKNKKFTFTDPRVVQTYKWVESYSRRLGKRGMAEFRSGLGNYYSPQNAFLAGKIAMEQHGTFLANVITNQKPDMKGKWAAAPFPSIDPALQNVTYCNADVFVIPRGAKHPREAFEFIAFVHRQDIMERLANSHCKISPLSGVSESFFANHSNDYVRVFDKLAASPNAHPSEPIPILPEVTAEIDNFVGRVALLDVDVEQGLQEMQDRLQKKYDSFMEEQRLRRLKAK